MTGWGMDISVPVAGNNASVQFNVSGIGEGRYAWNCKANDTIGLETFGQFNRSFTIDLTPPVVYLMSPDDHNQSSSTTITFQYNITDARTGITNCSLILNNAIYSTDPTITETVPQSFIETLAVGQYNWSIICFDTAGHSNTTAVRNLTIVTIPVVDTTAPYIISHDTFGQNATPEEINFTVNETNNINNITLTITHPDSSTSYITNFTTTLATYNSGSDIIYCNKAGSTHSCRVKTDINQYGDYTFFYYLEDDYSNSNTETWMFELGVLRLFTGTVEDHEGNGTQTTFTLYRPSTNDILHSFTTAANGYYAESISMRVYDLEFSSNGVTVRLDDVDLTSINYPIDMEIVPVGSIDIGVGRIRATADKKAAAFEVNLSTSGTITISYSDSVGSISDVYIYRCGNWNYTSRACEGTWNQESNNRDSSTGYISTDITTFSAYAVVDTGDADPAPSTSSSSGGGGSSSHNYYYYVNETFIEEKLNETKYELLEELSKLGELYSNIAQISKTLYVGEIATVKLRMKNLLERPDTFSVSTAVDVTEMISLVSDRFSLKADEEFELIVQIAVPLDTEPGLFTGDLQFLTKNNVIKKIPIELRVLESQEKIVDLKMRVLTKTARPGGVAKISNDIKNLGQDEKMNINLITHFIKPETEKIELEKITPLAIGKDASYTETIKIPDDFSMDRYIIKTIVEYTYQNKKGSTSEFDFIEIKEAWYNYKIFGIPLKYLLWLLVIIAVSILLVQGYVAYKKHQEKKKKYDFIVDLKELPTPSDRTAFIGKIAETDIRTFFDLDLLPTHSIIAGTTGSGKTIAAQVLAEEALMKGASVIVFDPSAQWTGFLRKCQVKEMMDSYPSFSMRPEEVRSFNGNVHQVVNPRQITGLKKKMRPGEINVFTLNKLKPKEIELFVSTTIKEIFDSQLEESSKLKTMIIYDEVHRLLPKFGGSGSGFIQIERGVREFRKWGVGLLLISQVLSDFVGAIKANINTEIQMRTRDENDLKRLETKYGEDILKSIVKTSVGIGMVENAAMNKSRSKKVRMSVSAILPMKAVLSLGVGSSFKSTMKSYFFFFSWCFLYATYPWTSNIETAMITRSHNKYFRGMPNIL